MNYRKHYARKVKKKKSKYPTLYRLNSSNRNVCVQAERIRGHRKYCSAYRIEYLILKK